MGQCLVIELPNPLVMCHDPPNAAALREVDKVLLLILGAAVQCPQKEHFIRSIKNLPFEMQHAFVDKIKDVTDNPEKIWPSELDDPQRFDSEQRDDLYKVLVRHVKRLTRERDSLAHKVVEITLASPDEERGQADGGNEGSKAIGGGQDQSLSPEKSHLALEASEYKAKIRKLNQQL